MSTPVTCTFKVPTSSDEFAYIGENGIGIVEFSIKILDK